MATAKRGKTIKLTTVDEELAYARLAWRGPVFVEHYRRHRPMVERTIAWLVAGGDRRLRYRGVERNQQRRSTRLAGANLVDLRLQRARRDSNPQPSDP